MPPITHPRLPAPLRKASIVDAAIDLFSERGFRGATTRELAAAAGITEPVLYQHFDTKQALYDAIIQSQIQLETSDSTVEQLEALSLSGDNRGYFTLLGKLLLDWHLDDPRFLRLLMYSHLERHELARLFYERRVAAYYDLLTRHLERQMEAGRFRRMDSLVAARTLSGMLAHQGMIHSIFCPDLPPPSREAIVQAAVDIFLQGISA